MLNSRQLKIGFVVDDTLDKPDGVQQYVLTLGAWLAGQGHEVHYLVGESTRSDVAHVHSLSRNVHVTFNGNRLSIPLPASRRHIRRLLATEKFDVLHVQVPYSPMLAQRVILAAPAGTAIVGTFHIMPHSKIVAQLARVLGWLLRPSLKRFHAMLAVSSVARAFAQQTFNVSAQVLPNVIVVDDFVGAKPAVGFADSLNIVFLGRLVERKGCMYLLQAVSEVIEHGLVPKPFRVLVCGKGELRPNLEAFVRRHHLEDIVTFTGFVSEADKPGYLAAGDVIAFPSHGGESFGIVLLEGMAAGRGVVLGGDNPGYASVLGPRPQQLIKPHDRTAFAKELARYLNSGATRKAAQEWQRSYVRQYDVPVVGQKLVEIYADALIKARNVR